ncbi:Permease YjgP/YjgQ family protein [Candidatus Filomicrobium marinum]|uniref:Permease YjgP/YjgQ family protein n=2 Tax=Filomicrobium TaxID=119044 RepID=A0A0D6JJ01_9HYPH|nr:MULTISPECIES: LPS export ABC transporter permease LptF [Filomicrobium]MCV0371540.1 LPS export ABC transporter permease LptF [Filomicrobium sp.]CFX37460.1 Permease YjgP/YjgQ family protein [Candidatus Filomicrobium marinum]CPR21622.1 Permease YjgP/YjgQ family protein [Candidatus Filomicrobium marinum]SDP62259.1 lipopolysaccharide export system permease protein [Filomicrobium insigne]
MSIISKYVFRQAAGALLLILLSLGGIVWIALALKQLNVVTSQGQDGWLLLKMTTLALPNLLAIIAPFAMLIAVMHTLNRLNGDSELIVLTASGATVWTTARPLIALALLVTMAVGFVNHIGMPWSLRLLREYIIQVRTDLLTQVIQPGRFSTAEKGLTFHIRERTPNGDLRGLIINDTRDKKLSQAYLAEVGQIVKQESGAFLVMTDGHILRRAEDSDAAQIIEFQKYAINLAALDENEPSHVDYKPRERYLDELLNPAPDDKTYHAQPGLFRAELHERFANPLYPIAFVLIALAAVGQAKSTRQNRTEGVILGFVAATGVRMGGLAVNNLVALNPVFIPLLYALPILACIAALALVVHNARPRAGPSRLESLRDVVTTAIGTVITSLLGRLRLARPQPAGPGPATSRSR